MIVPGSASPLLTKREFVFNQTISANTANYNLKAAAIAAGWDQVAPLRATVTVNAGVYLYSTALGSYGFDTGATFPAGSTLAAIFNGTANVHGFPGTAGAAGTGEGVGYGNNDGTAGGNGGPAFRAQYPISVTNNGTFAGGGAGGGGGHGGVTSGGAGGRGRGYPYLTLTAGNCQGAAAPYNSTYEINPAQPSGAFGGAGGNHNSTYGGGAGGNGGDYASAGGAGGNGGYGSYAGWAGGASGGAAVVGNANIIWLATGTRLGAIT